MKLQEKEFAIFEGNRPKVLLIGNGLAQCGHSVSWNALLDTIKDSTVFTEAAEKYIVPMPLKAAMLTNNSLATKMKQIISHDGISIGHGEGASKVNWDSFSTNEETVTELVKGLVDIGFDYILTTNYSYEVEVALTGKEKLSQKRIAEMQRTYEEENAQRQFLLNTFNRVSETDVWHIHGEARKPSSMIIGQLYYGKLLRRIIQRLDGTEYKTEKENKRIVGKLEEFRSNLNARRMQRIGSWVDAFILGDVYIVGLGLDFSESDLWWLLECKRNHCKALSGKTVFFEALKLDNKCPNNSTEVCDKIRTFVGPKECKRLLLKEVYGVECRNLGLTINSSEDYKLFYQKAAKSISDDEGKQPQPYSAGDE